MCPDLPYVLVENRHEISSSFVFALPSNCLTVCFHYMNSREIQFAKISFQAKSASPNFSQNNFTRNFPQTFPKKYFQHTRQSPGSRFSKMPHRTFHRIPASDFLRKRIWTLCPDKCPDAYAHGKKVWGSGHFVQINV